MTPRGVCFFLILCVGAAIGFFAKPLLRVMKGTQSPTESQIVTLKLIGLAILIVGLLLLVYFGK